jgi:hypothetical protein
MAMLGWLMRRVARPPDFVIGGDNPYLRRWWVIPRNRYFNIYLHHIIRDDDDRALHDHPWWNASLVLSGGYYEIVPVVSPVMTGWNNTHWRRPGSVVFRRATAAHRLALSKGHPCWSLFITGPRVRQWGFWCDHGWRHWKEFCAVGDRGRVGRGCD